MNTNFVIAMLLMVSSCIQVFNRKCKNTMLKCIMPKHGKYVSCLASSFKFKIDPINTALVLFSKGMYLGIISICSTYVTDSSLWQKRIRLPETKSLWYIVLYSRYILLQFYVNIYKFSPPSPLQSIYIYIFCFGNPICVYMFVI